MLPIPVSKELLIKILEDILKGVKTGDTLEGHFEFTLNYENPQEEEEDEMFLVLTTYRIGNSRGLSGMRVLGKAPDNE